MVCSGCESSALLDQCSTPIPASNLYSLSFSFRFSTTARAQGHISARKERSLHWIEYLYHPSLDCQWATEVYLGFATCPRRKNTELWDYTELISSIDLNHSKSGVNGMYSGREKHRESLTLVTSPKVAYISLAAVSIASLRLWFY